LGSLNSVSAALECSSQRNVTAPSESTRASTAGLPQCLQDLASMGAGGAGITTRERSAQQSRSQEVPNIFRIKKQPMDTDIPSGRGPKPQSRHALPALSTAFRLPRRLPCRSAHPSHERSRGAHLSRGSSNDTSASHLASICCPLPKLRPKMEHEGANIRSVRIGNRRSRFASHGRQSALNIVSASRIAKGALSSVNRGLKVSCRPWRLIENTRITTKMGRV
jgi:hypothetical protein